MDSEITPKMVAVALLIGLVLAIGGWYAYWALAKASTNNRYEVNTHTQQYQASLVSQERDRMSGYLAATDSGQKLAIAQQFCAVFPSLDIPPSDLVSAASQLCH